MSYSVLVRFADGTQHTYQDVPVGVSPQQIEQRAAQDFAGRRVVSLARQGATAAIPTAPTAAQAAQGSRAPQAPAAVAAAPVNPGGVVNNAIGTGEAALTALTGATGGALGMIGGTLKGLAEQILSGQFGTPEAARLVEQSASEGAQALTYSPRTAAGQEQAQVLGQAMQQLVPVAGLTPQVQMLGASVQPATQAATIAARSGVAGAEQAASSLMARQAARRQPSQAAPAATVEQVAQTAKAAADGSNKAAEVLATQAAPDPRIVKSAERLGVQDYLQPDHVTTSEAYRQVTGAIKSNPQTSVALAEREGLAAVAKRASDLVDEIGGTNDLSTLDATIKARMQDTHGQLIAREDGLYSQMRQQIDQRSAAPANTVLEFVQRRADDLGGAENLSALEKSILAKLTPRATPEGSTKAPTYALLDDVRKDVGAAARQQGAFGDTDTGLAKKLYSLLLDDQEQAVTAAGLKSVFDEARGLTVLRKGIEDDLSALFGKNLDRTFVAGGDVGLPGAVRGLASGDAARLTRLLSAVPEDLRSQVVASGISTVFRNAATRGEMNFTAYAKWWAGLERNRQAYSAIMSALPLSARKQLTALARVSQGVSDSLATRTKTGALNTIKQEMMAADGLMESLYSVAKRSAVAVPAEALSTAAGLPGAGISAALASALTKGKPKSMAAVDQLISSPEFTQLVKQRANTPAQKQAVRKVAKSKDFAKLLRAINVEMSLSERELFIVQSMNLNAGANERRQSAPTLQ
jgi:hypothetical protein